MYGWLLEDLGDMMPPAAANVPAPLLNIPGYDVREEIARGGMGIVYRAQQRDPRRTVALKMLLPHQAGSPEMVGRFRLEARAIAALEHPAILPVHHVGEHGGLPFFTMKFATGGTLAQRRAEYHGKWRRIADLMATLADAVHFAHERGVLHRDLKPGNVLFDEQGRPYVSDFGLAKLVGDDTRLTRSIDFLGTPHYVAPEVAARSARAATISSDVYALGAILYELLSGCPPFEAEGVPALLKKIAEEEPLPPSRAIGRRSGEANGDAASRVAAKDEARPASPENRNAVPRDLEVICLKCLAKEPARRYTSALDLASDLRRWLAGEPILARQISNLERLWLWSQRHRITAALITAVLVLLLALIAGLSVAAVRIADSRRAALQTVEALESQKANDLLAAGNTAEAIALAARRVRENPDNWADAARLMWALQRRAWAVPVRAPHRLLTPDEANLAERAVLVADRERRVWALCSTGTSLVVYDVLAAMNRQVWPLAFAPQLSGVAEEAGLVALTGRDGRVRFLDYRTGQMRASEFAGSLLALDARGRFAFLRAPDRSGQLLDLESGQLQTMVSASATQQGPLFAQFVADGQRLIVTDGEGRLRKFDLARGNLVDRSLDIPPSAAGWTLSPDGRACMARTEDETIFWDTETGRQLPTRPEIGVSFRQGAFRPGGSQFYQGGNTFGLAIFDPLSGEIVQMPPRGALLNGRCYVDVAGRRVAVQFNRFVGIFDGETGQPLSEPLPLAIPLVTAPRLAGGQCVTIGHDGDLILWQVKKNRLAPVVVRHSAAIQDARFSRDGRRVATASHDGTARIWDATSGQAMTGPLAHGNKVWSASFSPDGRRVVTGSWDQTARLWDAGTGEPLSPPLRASSYIFHVEFSPHGDQFLTCGEDGTVRTYETTTGKLRREFPEKGPVYWATFSPDGRWIATRPMYAHPKLWDARTGALLLELNEPGRRQYPGGVVTRGDFSKDGRWLALGSPNRHATVWRLPEGELHAVLNHVAVVRTASFSPDARTLLTTADDLTGQLWDLKTGAALSSPLAGVRSPWSPRNTGNSLRAGAIHPDGRRAITGGSDAALRFWDLRNGFPLGEPAEFGGSVMHAEFSPDGEQVVLACFDGTAHILPLPPILDRAPDWLTMLAEALVGQRFDSRGAVESVAPVRLWEVCERIRSLPASDKAAAWARKLLDL